MKKATLIVAALAFGATTAFAQDLTSKKGENYLPEAGDWAIGFDAVPFLGYFGNMFNAGNNSSGFSGQWTNSNQMITGKMFASETMAYRAGIRLGFGSNKWTNPVPDQTNTSATPVYKDDELKSSWNAIGLLAGMEMRRGKTRLQGYYGGQFMFWMSGMKDTYTYGNTMDATYPTPVSTVDFTTGATAPSATRPTEVKYGSTLGFGVRGFIGADYYVLPKISLGAEFGWGIGFSSTGATETTTQYMNAGSSTTTTTASGKSSSFGIDTDNDNFGFIGSSGSVLVHFHF